ncbi:hypothetical protein KAI30_00785 [Candidatus Bathyarchaeota archaeon]|nr:hypothetical protein [Candidatus Bathyarchaeota archaeon]
MENVTITLTPRQRMALEWALMETVDRLEESPSVKRGQRESVRTLESLESIQQLFEAKRDLAWAERCLAETLEEAPEDHRMIATLAERVHSLKAKIQN